jgi:hypothetical protein
MMTLLFKKYESLMKTFSFENLKVNISTYYMFSNELVLELGYFCLIIVEMVLDNTFLFPNFNKSMPNWTKTGVGLHFFVYFFLPL